MGADAVAKKGKKIVKGGKTKKKIVKKKKQEEIIEDSDSEFECCPVDDGDIEDSRFLELP